MLTARRLTLALAVAAAFSTTLCVAPAIANATNPGVVTKVVTRVVPCRGAPVARPAGYVIACADANWYLTGIRWVRWSASVAIARATDHLNDCRPYCYDGTFHASPTVIVLSDPVTRARWGPLFSVVSVLDAARLPGSRGATSVMALNLTPLP